MNVPQFLHIAGLIIVSAYVVIDRDRWKNAKHGVRPILLGLGMLVASLGIFVSEGGTLNWEALRMLAAGQDLRRIAATRMISLAYLAISCGIEILIVVGLKKLHRKGF